jgi:predicted ribosomally synthesized peptide with SipW-like signal peptide
VPNVNYPTALKPATLNRVPVRLLVALCALIGVGAYGTSASFTDAAFVAASFATGTIDLTVAGSSGVFVQGTPAELSLPQLTVLGMYPGGPAGIAELRLRNAGQIAMNLSTITFTTTNSGGVSNDAGTTALGQVARLKVVQYSGAQVCNAALMTGDGTLLPSSTTLSTALPTLPPGATVTYCLKVNIPGTVTNAPLAALNVDMRLHIRVTAVQV